MKRTVVGAHYGLKGWLVQRISAAIMAIFSIAFGLVLANRPHRDFEQWKALFSGTPMKIGFLLFLASLVLHAWVGMRDILMDYVHPVWIRLTLQVLLLLSLAAYSIWAVDILWGK